MLTKVRAYGAWHSAPTLFVDDTVRAESDLIQLRNVDGLDPVLNDGERNIVLTVRPNPDWNTWSPEALRRLLYSYFMTNQLVRLAFYSDDMDTVQIDGIVESFAANQFSKDPEYLASILCPNPNFVKTEPTVVTGDVNETTQDIEYGGNVPVGISLKVEHVSGTTPGSLTVQYGPDDILEGTYPFFKVVKDNIVTSTKYFRMSSVPGSKYAETVITGGDGTATSVLSGISTNEGADWPIMQPGPNAFRVMSPSGVQTWELSFYESYGGL